jgi:antitoxin component YwqK of YwqJK toxin-antitoxin module
MKKSKFVFFLWLFISVCKGAFSQDFNADKKYFIKENDTTFRFFFNRNYYLLDQNCSFVTIQRIIHLDPTTKKFHGPFFDLDAQNRVILEGNYDNGVKNGLFTSYHINGSVKWEVEYRDNMPVGSWKFYYPDELPAIELAMNTSKGVQIVNYWKPTGKLGVKNGKGVYEFKMKELGFSEFGNEFFMRKGRVSQGKPHGRWLTHLLMPNGKKIRQGIEDYEVGRLTYAVDLLRNYEYSYTSEMDLFPIEPFFRAELFLTKECTIDEDSEFNAYIKEVLETWFITPLPNLGGIQAVTVDLTITEEGRLKRMDSISNFSDQKYTEVLQRAIQSIPFWLPSYDGNQFIEDQLQLTFYMYPSGTRQTLQFSPIKIRRLKGF